MEKYNDIKETGGIILGKEFGKFTNPNALEYLKFEIDNSGIGLLGL